MSWELEMEELFGRKPPTVAIVSGGMDSVTLAYLLAKEYHDLILVSFDYDQRHKKELQFAALAAEKLDAEHLIVNLPFGSLLGGSALTDSDIAVPDGHYAEESMKITVVPNRNAIMLSIATGIAVARKARAVALGVHGGDHFIYPDCRPTFLKPLQEAFCLGNDGFISPEFRILTPFIAQDKAYIARVGDSLGVPWQDTWSCYKGGEVHCGTCGTCVERREAFELAGAKDPTEYASVSD